MWRNLCTILCLASCSAAPDFSESSFLSEPSPSTSSTLLMYRSVSAALSVAQISSFAVVNRSPCEAAAMIFTEALSVPVSCSAVGGPLTMAAPSVTGPDLFLAAVALFQTAGYSVTAQVGSISISGTGDAYTQVMQSGEQTALFPGSVTATSLVSMPEYVFVRAPDRLDRHALSQIVGSPIGSLQAGAVTFHQVQASALETYRQAVLGLAYGSFFYPTSDPSSVAQSLSAVFPTLESSQSSGGLVLHGSGAMLNDVRRYLSDTFGSTRAYTVRFAFVLLASDNEATLNATVYPAVSDLSFGLGSGSRMADYRPSLLLQLHVPADLVAGSRIPYAQTITADGVPQTVIEYVQTGVSLRATLFPDGSGRYRLHSRIEVTQASGTNLNAPVLDTTNHVGEVSLRPGDVAVLAEVMITTQTRGLLFGSRVSILNRASASRLQIRVILETN